VKVVLNWQASSSSSSSDDSQPIEFFDTNLMMSTGRQFFEIETNRADVDWELFATEVVSEDLRDQLEKEVFDE